MTKLCQAFFFFFFAICKKVHHVQFLLALSLLNEHISMPLDKRTLFASERCHNLLYIARVCIAPPRRRSQNDSSVMLDIINTCALRSQFMRDSVALLCVWQVSSCDRCSRGDVFQLANGDSDCSFCSWKRNLLRMRDSSAGLGIGDKHFFVSNSRRLRVLRARIENAECNE